jgi:hypothetical protein
VKDAELRRLFKQTNASIDEMGAQLRREMAEMREELRSEFRGENAETRRHIDVVAEGLRHDIQLVAEGVVNVDQKLDREAASIRDEMRRGFGETHAMLRFSHSILDRRITAIENRMTE